MAKMKAKVVHVPIPKNSDIRMMFEIATQLAGYPSESRFFYAAAQQVAMELLKENAARIKELEDKEKECSHTDLFRMTSGSGEKVTICNDCGEHLEE